MASRRTILLVDDEEIVLRTLRCILASRGFDVLTAGNGLQALEVSKGRSLDLLLTDVVMPGMTGPELARILRDRDPDLPVLFTAGMPDTPAIRSEVFDRGFTLIAKPFLPSQLLAAIDEVLGCGVAASCSWSAT